MKRFLMIGLVLLAAVLANGCASYNIQSVPSQIDESKTVKVEDNDTTITAFPILTEEDSKKYFDKNLIGNNLLAVYLNVLNTSPSVVEIIKSNLIIQAQQPSALARCHKKMFIKLLEEVGPENQQRGFSWALMSALRYQRFIQQVLIKMLNRIYRIKL